MEPCLPYHSEDNFPVNRLGASCLFWVQSRSPLSSKQNNGTVLYTRQEFGWPLGKGRKEVEIFSLCFRLSQQKELKQEKSSGSATGQKAHYTPQIRRGRQQGGGSDCLGVGEGTVR